ncbi:glycoside hydrolase family 43 protein [Exophiala viscosa]|uniref:Glycoside hydrolase family 43 protein n=1 Tax=Exophiala viscosa TaxID=2486360 RepID=A0AAN6DS02_9EURO|nr:glycoside hydrolase family 43 protein [Exophiala viscosa]
MLMTLFGHWALALGIPLAVNAANSTYSNPIFPGFFPDPSCISVPEWDNTFFCASSSFSVFPGIPIHASKDLANWRLVSNVLSRPEQLPDLAITNKSTSGIWASTIRYHEGIFFIMTTLVFDDQAQTNFSRWDNMIFQSTNPFESSSWSDPVHFNFTGYDTSPYWADNGTVYVTGSHPWEVTPGITQTTVNLTTGAVGSDLRYIWNGTGGEAPEGPHIYNKDGWYYLMIAEGGTGLNHMETLARSKTIGGPYMPDPANPIITNANTTQYFQTVGHADLFQDPSRSWWGVCLSTRSGPEFLVYPMGRETVMFPVTWQTGDWPILQPVRGQMSGWQMPTTNLSIAGEGPFTDAADHITFPPNSSLPIHLVHWRIPINASYTISPPGYANTLRLSPSRLNLTAYDGNYAGPEGQTFVGRRQTDTLFTYSVNMQFTPQTEGDEAGVSVFLTQNHHIDLGVVLLANTTSSSSPQPLVPYFRFSATSYLTVPPPLLVPVHASYPNYTSLSNTSVTTLNLYLEIKAINLTHYAFSAGPIESMSDLLTIGTAPAADVSFGFTGTLLGVYGTTNGRIVNSSSPGAPAYISDWKYTPQGRFIS